MLMTTWSSHALDLVPPWCYQLQIVDAIRIWIEWHLGLGQQQGTE
jgi:hypothetical protein